jgi:simple sugar transport system ATP-binding protein/ribose transport system ATP-binding protein
MIALRGISKRFGGVQALADIDLTIAEKEIHALVGENGAGKSTVGKIIAGVIRADGGELLVDGQERRYLSPHQALEDGITTIQQEIALVPQRSVIENVFLGIESRRFGNVVDERDLQAKFRTLIEVSGFDLRPGDLVRSLRLADQQKVEILRALARNARVIVFDEPTAALSAEEAAKLIQIVRALRDQGKTIVYVSHYLPEILSLADRVTILRNGRHVRTSQASDETPDKLVEGMLGRAMELAFPPKAPPAPDAPLVLHVRDLGYGAGTGRVSLDIRAGEIVGLAGLVGSGRSEVARAIFGLDRREGGEVSVGGEVLRGKHPKEAIRAGVALVPESRKDQGLHMGLSARVNVSLPHLRTVTRQGVVDARREREGTAKILDDLAIAPNRPEKRVRTFSGGNQQKVLFAKWLFRQPKVLVADEPTRGVDVGAKVGIYELLASLAREGMAVLLISSEIEEILGLSHRVIVMRQGEIVAELGGDAITEEAIMHAAFGTQSGRPAA